MWLGFRAPSTAAAATLSGSTGIGTARGTYARLLRADDHDEHLGFSPGKELEVRGRMAGGLRVSVVG